MPALSTSLPDALERAVAALGRSVTAQLRGELAGAGGERQSLAEELRRRAEDYRSWHRMGEVPPRVGAVAARLVDGEPAAQLRAALELAVLDELARAHRAALAGSPCG